MSNSNTGQYPSLNINMNLPQTEASSSATHEDMNQRNDFISMQFFENQESIRLAFKRQQRMRQQILIQHHYQKMILKRQIQKHRQRANIYYRYTRELQQRIQRLLYLNDQYRQQRNQELNKIHILQKYIKEMQYVYQQKLKASRNENKFFRALYYSENKKIEQVRKLQKSNEDRKSNQVRSDQRNKKILVTLVKQNILSKK